jgi:hypothetical protein
LQADQKSCKKFAGKISSPLIVAGIARTHDLERRCMTHAQRNQKILDAIAKETARALASQKTARETLIEEGIYTAKGKLRAEYGGERKKAKVAA